jgi:pseudoazurin
MRLRRSRNILLIDRVPVASKESELRVSPMLLIAFGACLSGLSAMPASAKTVQIEMKNKGAAGMMVFEPAYAVAQPGDTVRFVPTDPGHNAETIDGMLPEGVKPAVGGMGKVLEYKVTKAGLYGFECKPHFGLGMVALVKVGKGVPANLDAARKATMPPLAGKRMAPLIASASR